MHAFPARPDKSKGKVCVLGSYRRCSLVSNGRRYLLNMLGQPVRFLCSVHTRKGQSIKPKWLLVGEAFFDQKLLTCRTLDVKSFLQNWTICCNGFVFLLMFGSSACSNVAPRSPTIQLMLRCPLKPSTECCFDRSIGHRGGFAFRARHHWVLLEPSLANAVSYKAKYNNQGLPSVGFGSFYLSWFCCTLHRKKYCSSLNSWLPNSTIVNRQSRVIC